MGGGGSQRLLCLNPTTVMVVLLLGLWLLLGCDNISIIYLKYHFYITKYGLFKLMDHEYLASQEIWITLTTALHNVMLRI